jgi:ribosomal protein L11 methyltransferase
LTGKKHPIIITLDLRGAFGTGNHPTTQLCAEVLTLLLTKHAIQSVCDIGTGTGILSILAAKLGIKTIHGFDIDPLSVKRAKANNRINSTGCKFWKNNILKDTTQKKYDLIVANLQTEILSEALNQITALISPQGWLILSGISSQWQEEMAKKIKALNPISLDIKEKDGWCAFWAQLT